MIVKIEMEGTQDNGIGIYHTRDDGWVLALQHSFVPIPNTGTVFQDDVVEVIVIDSDGTHVTGEFINSIDFNVEHKRKELSGVFDDAGYVHIGVKFVPEIIVRFAEKS